VNPALHAVEKVATGWNSAEMENRIFETIKSDIRVFPPLSALKK